MSVGTFPSTLTPAKAFPSLRRNFVWTLAGNVVYMGCSWGVLVALAKLGSPESVGRLALGLALGAPVMLLANLQLRSVQATDTDAGYAFGDYLGLRLLTVTLALAIIGGIALVGRYEPATASVVVLVGLMKAFEAVSDVVYGSLQRYEQMDRIATALMLKGVFGLLGLAGTLALTGSLGWAIVANLGTSFAVIVGYELPCAARLQGGAPGIAPRWRWGVLGRIVRLALPLGLVMMLISLNANVPRYFIEHRFGLRELGVFAALAYLMTAGTAVVGALGQSATPRLARMFAAGDRAGFLALVRRLLVIGALLGIAGLAVVAVGGAPLLQAVYTPEYAGHAGTLLVLMLAATIGYVASFLGYALTAARRFAVQAPLAAVVSAVTVGACVWLVPTAGGAGAAWALVVSAVAQLSGNALALHRAVAGATGTEAR